MASMPVDLDRRERVCAELTRAIRAGDAGAREQREAVLRLRAGMCANPGLVAFLGGAHDVPQIDCRKATDGTVAEIVAASTARGERVLIAAAGRAEIDEAVALLPAELTVIRLEEAGTGWRTLDGAADELRERALVETKGAADPLLRDWRDRIARPSRRLRGELLRHADVIAATWLGCGRPEFADLEYDLVVVAGAARLPLAVAIVPLVRAGRAVLIG